MGKVHGYELLGNTNSYVHLSLADNCARCVSDINIGSVSIMSGHRDTPFCFREATISKGEREHERMKMRKEKMKEKSRDQRLTVRVKRKQRAKQTNKKRKINWARDGQNRKITHRGEVLLDHSASMTHPWVHMYD